MNGVGIRLSRRQRCFGLWQVVAIETGLGFDQINFNEEKFVVELLHLRKRNFVSIFIKPSNFIFYMISFMVVICASMVLTLLDKTKTNVLIPPSRQLLTSGLPGRISSCPHKLHKDGFLPGRWMHVRENDEN